MGEGSRREAGVCWFCGASEAGETSAFKAKLWRAGETQTQVVVVPRCELCQSEHDKDWVVGLGGFLSIVAGVAVWIARSFLAGIGAAIVVAIASAALGMALRRKRRRKLAALGPNVKIAPQEHAAEHPIVSALVEQGWFLDKDASIEAARKEGRRLSPDGKPVWHQTAKSPGELYAATPPATCPTCGANTKPMIKVDASNEPVRCVVCGAWGCRLNCCHFHDEKNRPTRDYVKRGLGGGAKVYTSVPWRHNQCCECGYEPRWWQKTS